MKFRRPWFAAATLVAAMGILAGCIAPQDSAEPEPSASVPTTVEEFEVLDSSFTVNGTFQSHIEIDGIDFVFTIWPTQATPRTHEWYPRGEKHFSFTLIAYDLDRDLRDPFNTKRQVWLDRINVTSTTVRSGDGEPESPYRLDADASTITFDPEPVTSRRGMRITSPKGGFELRHQVIGDLAVDTIGVIMVFEATVHIQRARGARDYQTELVRIEVPMSIFPSDEPTEVARIPINAQ